MAYYRDVMLTQALLPAIHDVAGDVYAFQQARTCLVNVGLNLLLDLSLLLV